MLDFPRKGSKLGAIQDECGEGGKLMPKKSRICEDIRKYFEKQTRNEKETLVEKEKFVKPLVDLFNTPEVQSLLKYTGAEIIFVSYGSSRAPDYEMAISQDGLLVKRHGKVDEKIPFPATIKQWSEIIPCDGWRFSNDSVFKPTKNELMAEIERQLRNLIK